MARGGSEGTSAVLEVWGQGRLLRELHVPSKQHGPLYNDGWFSLGPAWSPNESRIAYVAEVRHGHSLSLFPYCLWYNLWQSFWWRWSALILLPRSPWLMF